MIVEQVSGSAWAECPNGVESAIRVGDSVWLVSGPDLPAGAPVRVTGQDGVLLLVEPA